MLLIQSRLMSDQPLALTPIKSEEQPAEVGDKPSEFPREQIAKVEAIIQFDITGTSGCKRYLQIDHSQLRLHEGSHKQPSVTVSAQSDDWLSLINGDTAPAEMFLNGTLQVGGNLELIVGLVDAFSLNPLGTFKGDKWRLDINYLNAITLHLGRI